MRDDDRFVNDLLEAALKSYSTGEPRAGLETRILAGVRSRQRAARRHMFAWAAAACAGIAILALTLHVHRAPLRRPTKYTSLAANENGAQRAPLQPAKAPANVPAMKMDDVGAALVAAQGAHEGRPYKSLRASRSTRPEQFPTPMPLTEQEKLLLAYVRQAAQSGAPAEMNVADEAPLTDLQIPEITIAPLHIEPLDDTQSESGK